MRLQAAILRSAALIVPGARRAEWLAEWFAELWYIQREDRTQATRFCLGAFRDALSIRRSTPFRLDTPAQCLALIGLAAAVCLLAVFHVPDARRLMLPFPYRDAGRLALFSRLPDTPLGDYRNLAAQSPGQCEDLAFYRIARARVAGVDLPVATATGNLFELLGVPVPRNRGGLTLVVSDSVWARLQASGQAAAVGAVISVDSWQLPGRADAWLIDDAAVAALPAAATGYVVGRFGRELPARAVPLRSYPAFALPAVVLIALLVSAATTFLRFWPRRARFWLFLGAKIALLVAVVFPCTFLLQAAAGEEIRPCVIFGLLIAFRWALLDQQKRCPQCLRRLAHPSRIGVPSETFLEWYGTELICVKGHGLLHVPGAPTASSGAGRWLSLDRSWSALFS